MTGPDLVRPWRSTPLRLTGILVLVFIVSSLASFAVAYRVVRSGFDAALEDQLNRSLATYRSIEDFEDLVERLTADATAADPGTSVRQYTPARGPRISNVEAFPSFEGLAMVSESAVSGDGLADSYLARSERVGRGQLIVAQTREQIIDMGEVFTTVFLVGILPTLAIATAAGLAVARRAGRKINAIRSALADLAMGNLDARVKLADGFDDLGQIGDSVNRMAGAQQASIASLRQISADIAHDLKTPIQRLAVLLERLSAGAALSADQDALVGQALAETDRIARTFQALLQIAQIEGGAVQDRFVPVDLRNVASDLVDLYTAPADETRHRLRLTVTEPGPFAVSGDRHLLGQVIANLIENGLRHVPPGGEVEVSLSRRAGSVLLSVTDDGPGIPEQERGNVLRRLYRLERSRTTEGNGLGLSLVAAVCDLHGATLKLEDNAPGLRVRITFPAIDPARAGKAGA